MNVYYGREHEGQTKVSSEERKDNNEQVKSGGLAMKRKHVEIIDLISDDEEEKEGKENEVTDNAGERKKAVRKQSKEARQTGEEEGVVPSQWIVPPRQSSFLLLSQGEAHAHRQYVDLTTTLAESATETTPPPPPQNDTSLLFSFHPSTPMEVVRSVRPHPKEDALVTDQIIPLLDRLPCLNVATCTSPCYDHSSRIANNLSIHPLHYQQRDKWSCGFRNMQMLMSALLPLFPTDHPCFDFVSSVSQDDTRDNHKPLSCHISSSPLLVVPTLKQIQTYLERCWTAGYDPNGAAFYRNCIVGKRSKIGAVEVSSAMSYLGIDSTVIQFIRCPESRLLLAPFVYAYFTKKFVGQSFHRDRYDSPHHCACVFCAASLPTSTSKSMTHASHIFKHLYHDQDALVISNHHPSNLPCRFPLPPLYLQWEGHSVTIVGIEVPDSSGATGWECPASFNLLVFDPMKKGDNLKNALSTATSLQPNNKTSSLPISTHTKKNDVFSHSKQQQNCDASVDNKRGALAAMRLPVEKLMRKDCQIVCTSFSPLTKEQQQRCRERKNFLTAAPNAVAMTFP